MLKNDSRQMEVSRSFAAILLDSSLSTWERGTMAKILVIEDEETVRDNIWELLDAEGFETLVAENGYVGLQLATQALPDLILCDLRMPELDGYGVLKALRAQPTTATIPVMFLTAKAANSDFSYGMALGAEAYLTKPFFLAELLAAIAKILQTNQSSFNLEQMAVPRLLTKSPS